MQKRGCSSVMGYAENKIKRDWALLQFENGLGFGDGSDCGCMG